MSTKKNLSNSVDDMIARKLSRSKANEYDNQIVPIVDEIAFYYNSINVLIGKQGTGKTFFAFRELLKINKLNRLYQNGDIQLRGLAERQLSQAQRAESLIFHQIIYVTDNGTSDTTYQNIGTMIDLIPLSICPYKDVVSQLEGLMRYKQMYLEIRDKVMNRENIEYTQEQIEELLELLNVKDFSKPRLHTLVLFDDAANNPIFEKKGDPMTIMLTRCRHLNISVIINIQKLTAISTTIRSQTASFFIFPGFPMQEVSQMGKICNNMTLDELKYEIRKLKDKQILWINNIDGESDIINLSKIKSKVEKYKEEYEEELFSDSDGEEE